MKKVYDEQNEELEAQAINTEDGDAKKVEEEPEKAYSGAGKVLGFVRDNGLKILGCAAGAVALVIGGLYVIGKVAGNDDTNNPEAEAASALLEEKSNDIVGGDKSDTTDQTANTI